jgi:hypothetical protein
MVSRAAVSPAVHFSACLTDRAWLSCRVLAGGDAAWRVEVDEGRAGCLAAAWDGTAAPARRAGHAGPGSGRVSRYSQLSEW